MRQLFTLILTALIFAGVGMAVSSRFGHRHGPEQPGGHGGASHAEAPATGEFERGPHRGRMLRDGDFAIEITIFEEGVPPEFHVYPYLANKPINPSDVKLSIELGRLGNRVDRIAFTPEESHLKGDQVVVEPHSFDVKVRAEIGGKTSEWSYQSYEGRTQISAKAAEAAGIKIEKAGSATIKDAIELSGVISMNEDLNAKVGGRFPGIVKALNKAVGESVRKGDVLATIDSNVTLRDYSPVSPIDGVVVARSATIGSITTTDSVLFEIADMSTVWVELHAFGKDRERVKVGQNVIVESHDMSTRADGTVAYVTPVAEAASQAIVIRVVLENKDAKWVPGSFVRGTVTVADRNAPLAVKTSGLQRFRDFTVVFAKVDDTYEVRMLDLGASDGTWTEVLGGIEPGQDYVAENSFLIKADIEKSGASHDH
ncbi:MAG: efflux RND transporter periplasmic adaptor subunit [Hyphomicrobium sp.]